MRRKEFKVIMVSVLALALAVGCSENKDSDKVDLQFRLTDMPGEYQQVNIDVQEVNVILNDTLIELATNQGIYNLLEFMNGKDTLIVDDEVPSGLISQIRLVLGEQNTIMVDSVLHDLKTPSAQQSGLKLNVHNEFVAGESYAYVIDFMVEKSIVARGNGTYSLKPVIRVFTQTLTGSVQGVVSPAGAKALVRVMNESDTASTYADTTSGKFMVRGLEEAVYSIEFLPVEGFSDSILNDIEVLAGQATVLDTMFLN